MKKEKSKILYFMHVPWSWIKQRPHFIAEGLAEFYDLTVITRREFKKPVSNNNSSIVIKSLIRLPFERLLFISVLNNILYKVQLRTLVRQADIIWLTSPLQIDWVQSLTNKILVYDCMDDMLEFPISKELKVKLQIRESTLFNRASIVLSSSAYLKYKLLERYGKREIFVVNNALKAMPSSSDNIKFPIHLKQYSQKNQRVKIVYIGTIAQWLDFSLIECILQSNENIEVCLFGPSEISIPNVNRLFYYGSIDHELVFPIMEEANILIMPFVVNELIKSVNPVKLYEYIASGKPCIAPLYQESQKFQDFVYLYKSESDCLKIISSLLLNGLKSKRTYVECRCFAENNTWNSRVKQIAGLLDDRKGNKSGIKDIIG